MPYRNSHHRGFVPDYWILMALAILVAIGVAMSFSVAIPGATLGNTNPLTAVQRQVTFLVSGFVLFLAAILFPVRWYRRVAVPFFLLTLALLVLVKVAGTGAGGAERWLKVGPLRFQPSELAKLAIVWFVAWYASVRRHRLHLFFRGLLPALIPLGLLILLVVIQPNVSTAGLLLFLAALMLFLTDIPLGLLLKTTVLGGVLTAVMVAALWTLPPLQAPREKVAEKFTHVSTRIDKFLHPEKDQQRQYVMLGLSEGGLVGAGIGRGKIKFTYLYEANTDFVYAVIGEEMGILGLWMVLALYLLLGWRATVIAQKLWERQKDPMLYLTAAGIGLVLWLFPLIHMMVVLGLVPETGQPLPFISRGGTNLWLHMVLLGILLRLHHVAQTGREVLK